MRGVFFLLNKKLTDICNEYGVPVPILKLSTMKTANGIFWYKYDPRAFKRAITSDEVLKTTFNRTIKISKYIMEHFGYKRAEETLLHEIAHYLDMVFNKRSYDIDPHGESFKKICVNLGGSMNEYLATGVFSSAASADFVSSKVGYVYTCPCGKARRKTIHKLSEKTLYNYSCNSCRTKMKHFNVEKLG